MTQRPRREQRRVEGGAPFNPYFYVPKYHSSDALPAPEVFFAIDEYDRKSSYKICITITIVLLHVRMDTEEKFDMGIVNSQKGEIVKEFYFHLPSPSPRLNASEILLKFFNFLTTFPDSILIKSFPQSGSLLRCHKITKVLHNVQPIRHSYTLDFIVLPNLWVPFSSINYPGFKLSYTSGFPGIPVSWFTFLL